MFAQVETWLHRFNLESNRQIAARNLPLSRRHRNLCCFFCSQCMPTLFWNGIEIVLIDCLEHSSTVIGTYYAKLVRSVRSALIEQRCGKLGHGVQLHRANMPLHTASQVVVAIKNAWFELPIVLASFGTKHM